MHRALMMIVGLGIGCGCLVGLPAPAAQALEVVGCLYESGAPPISADPQACPPEQRLDIVSLKTSWTNTPDVGGGGAGRAQAGPFVLAKRLDQMSPRLFFYVVTGRHLKAALIAIFEPRGGPRAQRLFSILLEDVAITRLETSAAESSRDPGAPLEMVELDYAKITLRDDVSGQQTQGDFF